MLSHVYIIHHNFLRSLYREAGNLCLGAHSSRWLSISRRSIPRLALVLLRRRGYQSPSFEYTSNVTVAASFCSRPPSSWWMAPKPPRQPGMEDSTAGRPADPNGTPRPRTACCYSAAPLSALGRRAGHSADRFWSRCRSLCPTTARLPQHTPCSVHIAPNGLPASHILSHVLGAQDPPHHWKYFELESPGPLPCQRRHPPKSGCCCRRRGNDRSPNGTSSLWPIAAGRRRIFQWRSLCAWWSRCCCRPWAAWPWPATQSNSFARRHSNPLAVHLCCPWSRLVIFRPPPATTSTTAPFLCTGASSRRPDFATSFHAPRPATTPTARSRSGARAPQSWQHCWRYFRSRAATAVSVSSDTT